MHPSYSTCLCCGKRIPHYWAYCGNTCRAIASGKLRPVTIKEALEGKR